MKRLLAYLFIVLGFTIFIQTKSYAPTRVIDVKAKQIILINSNTNTVLYEKNSNHKITSAHFNKIMTSIIVFDAIRNGQISLKDKLTVSEKAWKISTKGYSAMFVMNGDKVSVENLLRGLIVASGNDAAIVLAEGLAGSETNFVKLMNDKAKEIGINNTKFYNSTGIDNKYKNIVNFTTVKDVALMSSYLVNNYSNFYYFFGEKDFTWNRTGGDPITQGNRNPLLYKNMNVDGLKTSYNQADRYQLAASMYLNNNNDRLIVVGSGFETKNYRSKDSAKLLTFGKTFYHTFNIAQKEPSQTQKVGKKKELNDLDKIADLISKAKNPEPGTYTPDGDSDQIVAKIISNKIATCWSIPMGLPATEKNLMVRIKLSLNYDGSIKKIELLNHSRMNQPGQGFYKVLAESVLRATRSCAPFKVRIKDNQEILIKVDARNILFGKPSIEKNITDIAKAEPSQTQKVAKIEKLNPKKNISKSSNNKVALIIGINNYAYIPKATFANHDAIYFHHYAKNIFGIKNENIKLLIDREANLINFVRATKKWLPGKIKNGKTELIIFFAGHGLASNDRKDLYILPQDGDTDLLRQTGISLSELYKHISELRPKNVTIFMDASFSGASPEATFANLIVNSKLKVPDNFTIFNSSKLNQISSSLKELKHGIFSYYLMKGLEGKADNNQDKKITNGELLAYMDLNVPQKASELGRQQDPLLTGDPDKVLISNNNKTQITKNEPTIIPKKKIKVAKKEPKQEEFKPEKVNQDNIKPIIDIKSEYTFKDAEYTFKGKVKDKGGSEKLYLFSKKGDSKRKLVTTDKKGKFEITGFSLESEEITLIAIDSSNNETKKIVKVIIDIEEETEIAKVYEQLKPIKKGKKDNNRVAIIIGVESYEKSSKALYADNDAKMFKYFATKALGISSANIKLLVDNEAKRLDTIEALKAWLPKKILKDKSELFVFFSGHGYPSNDNNLYLIPQNGDPRFLEESALSKNYIIEQIQKLQPKSVTMFFDACYSGNGKDGEVLVAGLKPIRKLEIKEEIPENFYIFSSSDYNQESSTIKEAEHGIFSYYLMKGLEGNADQNKDKKITNGELIAYLKDNVSQEAFTQNREQDPMLAGDPDKILMSYR